MVQPDTRTLAVHGDVDMTNAAGYAAQARDLLELEGVRTFVIDLAGAHFMDSQGLGFLVESRNIALDRDIDLRLRNVQPRVLRVLQITGLTPVFTIED